MRPKIGILVHGRHVQTAGWEKIVWGEAPEKLGALPMMILVVLNRGIRNIKKIVFGTGASERDGLKEAEYTKRYLLTKSSKEELAQFDLIRKHPNFRSRQSQIDLDRLIQAIVCETTSRNTIEEITVASEIFAEAKVTEVIQVTCASHAPRCIRESAVLAEKRSIYHGQIWSVVSDMTTYDGTYASDVTVLEPPHRIDDPMLLASIKPHKVFPRFYKILTVEERKRVLREIDALIESAID